MFVSFVGCREHNTVIPVEPPVAAVVVVAAVVLVREEEGDSRGGAEGVELERAAVCGGRQPL